VNSATNALSGTLGAVALLVEEEVVLLEGETAGDNNNNALSDPRWVRKKD
jgi:hypothetical protein